MALTPEDGSGLPDADTYFTLAEARAYAADYGYTLDADDTLAEVQLRKAAQYVDANNFKGTKLNPLQGLSFPRVDVYCEGVEVVISQQLLIAGRAQVIYGNAINAGTVVRGNDDGSEVQKSEVVGSVSESYFQSYNTAETTVITEAVDMLGCLIGGGNLNQFDVWRK